MKKQVGLIMMLGAVCFIASGVQADLTEWSDDFETANPNWQLNGTWRDSGNPYEGTYSLYDGGANGAYAVRSIGSADSTYEVSFELYLRSGAADSSESVYGTTAGSVDGNAYTRYQAQLKATFSGGSAYLQAFHGETLSDTVEVSADTWYKMTLLITPNAATGGTYSWYIDDVLQYSDLGFRASNMYDASTAFSTWHFQASGSMDSFIDNVNVTIPEPATLSFIALGTALFGYKSRRRK